MTAARTVPPALPRCPASGDRHPSDDRVVTCPHCGRPVRLRKGRLPSHAVGQGVQLALFAEGAG